MNYTEWTALSTEMAARTIAGEMMQMYRFPRIEDARRVAHELLSTRNQQAEKTLEHMKWSLIVLEQMGYEIRKKDSVNSPPA